MSHIGLRSCPGWWCKSGNDIALSGRVSAANERNVRAVIENGFPPVQIYGTTGRTRNASMFRPTPFRASLRMLLVTGANSCANALYYWRCP